MKNLNILITIVSLLFFAGCNNEVNTSQEEVDIFDPEWNKNLELEPNTLFYLDSDGEQHLVNNIDDMCFRLLTDCDHLLELNVNDETFQFVWYDEDMEIIPGIVELRKYGLRNSDNYSVTEYRGILNILEVSKGEWETLNEKELPRREIYIKAVFHFKKEIYKERFSKDEDYIKIGTANDVKGVFVYSGFEQTVGALL